MKAVPGDVGRDGLGLDETGRAALAGADVVIHSAATVSFDAPLTQAVEINLLGPSRVAAAIAEVGSAGHLIAVSTAYVASTHQGEAKEELLSENRFTLDVPLGGRGRRGPAPARRPAGRVAQARQPAGVHQEGARRDRRRRRPPDRGAGREAARGVGQRRARQGGHRPRPLARLARRLPVHQGARRDAPWSSSGRARCRSPSCGPRSSSPRSSEPRPGWIRGFRMAEPIIVSYARGLLRRVPRRARGHHRRDPGRPGGGGHPGRRRARARAGAAEGVPGGLRRAEPAALRATGRARHGLLPAQPALRRPRPAHQRARMVLPRARAGAAPAPAAPTRP